MFLLVLVSHTKGRTWKIKDSNRFLLLTLTQLRLLSEKEKKKKQ